MKERYQYTTYGTKYVFSNHVNFFYNRFLYFRVLSNTVVQGACHNKFSKSIVTRNIFFLSFGIDFI